MKVPTPANETDRLETLKGYQILDTAPKETFDDIVKIAASICGTPIAIMSLVDDERQWFKAQLGLPERQTARDHAFCAYTILEPELMEVEDALQDERFSHNPLVLRAPNIRFYAGAPLLAPGGQAMGSLCVIDRAPRKLSEEQKSSLTSLARLVMTTLELRRVSAELAEASANIKTMSGLLPICASCKQVRNDDGYWQQVEVYIQNNTDATFTHGLCPGCSEKYFPGIKPESKQ